MNGKFKNFIIINKLGCVLNLLLLKIKTLGRCPKPRKLFEESLLKDFDKKPKTTIFAHNHKLKVFILINLITVLMTGCIPSGINGITGETPEPEIQTPTAPVITPLAEAAPLESNAPVPQKGGEITLSMRQPKTLNPLLNEDVTVDTILKLIFEPLVILDENLKPTENIKLVKNIHYASDGLSATVEFNPEAKWGDGTAISADDLDFSIKMLKNAGSGVIYKNNVSNIYSCEVISGLTAVIRFREVFSGMPYKLMFPIVPKHYYENTSENKNMSPMGNGAYKFDEYTLSKEMLLSASSFAPASEIFIERVRVIITPDYESDILCFEQKITDALPSNTAPHGKYRGNPGVTTTEYPTGYFDLLGFNLEKPAFANIEVRKAIASLIPYDTIISSVYLNYAQKAATPVRADSWLYEPDIEQYGFDITSAAEILSGRKLKILVNSENPERVKIAQLISESLVSAGVISEVEEENFGQFIKRLSSGDFDMFVGGFLLSDIPDFTFFLHSDNIPAGKIPENNINEETGSDKNTENDEGEEDEKNEENGNGEENASRKEDESESNSVNTATLHGNNYFRLNDKEMDTKLVTAYNAVDEEEYISIMSDIQKYIARTLPFVGIAFRDGTLLTGSRIFGEFAPTNQNPYNGINLWYAVD